VPYVVGAVHLAVMALYFHGFRGSFLGGDSGDYFVLGKAIVTGVFEAPRVDRAIGYPLVLSAAYGLLPSAPFAVAIALNYVFYMLTISWIGRLSDAVGLGTTAGRVAQLLFALVPNMAIFANLVMTEVLAALLLCIGTDLVVRAASSGDDARARNPKRLVFAGAVAAALFLVRSEYLLVLPVLLAVCLVAGRGRAPRTTRLGGRGIVTAGVGFLAVVLTVNVFVRAAAPAGITMGAAPSLLYRSLWLSFYDLELTHFRLHVVNGLSERVHTLRGDEIAQRLEAVRLDYTGGSPLPDRMMAAMRRDLESMRTHGLGMDEGQRHAGVPYLRVFAERFAAQPLEYFRRTGLRLFYAMAAVDLDWPTLRNHLIHSAVLVPVSAGAYLSCLVLLARRRTRTLAVALVGVAGAYSAIVHGALVYDQRYILPAVPLLSILSALGLLNWTAIRAWLPEVERAHA